MTEPGGLRSALAERARQAVAAGALRPIRTRVSYVEDGGVQFIVRSVATLARKDEAGAGRRTDAPNPFLPPDPALTVGEITPTHIGVLNKYPVVERHLLIVTKRFLPQQAALDCEDFTALTICLEEIDGIAFYNAGTRAGASQPHRHLQLVPLPLGPGPWAVPIEALFGDSTCTGGTWQRLRLPFEHAFVRLEPPLAPPRQRAAERMHVLYQAAMKAIGVEPPSGKDDPSARTAPYNLLLTRRWMLAVPRSKERVGSIAVNALGFVGSLFVRDPAEMQRIRETGPMSLLRAAAVPTAPAVP